jgi:hypothetical protein
MVDRIQYKIKMNWNIRMHILGVMDVPACDASHQQVQLALLMEV